MNSEWIPYNRFYDVLKEYDDNGELINSTTMRVKDTHICFTYDEMIQQVHESETIAVGRDAWREFDIWFTNVYLVQRDSPTDPFTTDDGFIEGI